MSKKIHERLVFFSMVLLSFSIPVSKTLLLCVLTVLLDKDPIHFTLPNFKIFTARSRRLLSKSHPKLGFIFQGSEIQSHSFLPPTFYDKVLKEKCDEHFLFYLEGRSGGIVAKALGKRVN